MAGLCRQYLRNKRTFFSVFNLFSVIVGIVRCSWPTVEPPKEVLWLVETPAPWALHYLPDVPSPHNVYWSLNLTLPRRLTVSDIQDLPGGMCQTSGGVPYVKVYRYNPKTYVQGWTVKEIMAREKCGILAGPRTVPVSWQSHPCSSLSVES